MKSLLDLLNDAGWSNSIEDLGTALGAPRDNEEGFAKITTEMLLRTIVVKLSQSTDYKVRDMASRYEINQQVKTVFRGDCCHNIATVEIQKAFALFVDGLQSKAHVTFAQLQQCINSMFSPTTKEEGCERCQQLVVKETTCEPKRFCDPDFLTVVFPNPVCFEGGKSRTTFGFSSYDLKVVLHWDSIPGCASVSREKLDGWWWHGVDKSQRPDFKYDCKQLASDAHMTDAIALMMVRIDLEESDQLQSSWTNNNGHKVNDGNHVEERIIREPATVSEEDQFQQDLAKAQAISRKETPGCLGAEEVIQLGREAASRLGILCNKPNLPLENNCFIPMDGDCIFSCCCHANDPTLRGVHLKNGAWELRVSALGIVLDKLKHFTDEQWSMLQAIVSGNDKEALSKEEILAAIESYMESGQYVGNVGDLLPQFAASFLQQPILVIEIQNCRVSNINWVEPVEMFGGDPQSDKYPVVVLLQLKHYETLLLDDDAKEVAKTKFDQWRISTRVAVSQGQGLDVSFNPPSTSTQRDIETEPDKGSLLSQVKSYHIVVSHMQPQLPKNCIPNHIRQCSHLCFFFTVPYYKILVT